MKYESLAELIEPYADGPFDELPEGLGERVASAFSPVAHWDDLAPNRRRLLARQRDNHNDPANRRENEYYFALVSQLQEAESQKLKWELLAPQNITEADIKEKKLSAFAAQMDVLQKQIDAPYSETPDAALVMAVSASDGVEPAKAGPLPVEQGLSTKDIAQAFDGVNGWDFERWRKNLSASKWLHSARIAIGGAGGASSVWNPLMLAQLMHDDAKGEREKEKLMKVFNSRFTLNPALGPWRDDFNEYFATHCATD